MKNLSVGYSDISLFAKARKLALQLDIPINNEAFPRLRVDADRLVLLMKQFLPIAADFACESLLKRQQEGKKQGLIRACKPAKGMHIIDATAGWGRDAAILASFGAEVCMLERNCIMGVLLNDALQRLADDSPLKPLLSLVYQDSTSYLQALNPTEYPDVIYIDPMHPVRQKAALVKKEMQALQHLIGPDKDVQSLIALARIRAKQRVVVKWPQKLPSVLAAPNISVPGKTVRFDIWLS